MNPVMGMIISNPFIFFFSKMLVFVPLYLMYHRASNTMFCIYCGIPVAAGLIIMINNVIVATCSIPIIELVLR